MFNHEKTNQSIKKAKVNKKAPTKKSAPKKGKKVVKTKPVDKKNRKVPKGRTLLTLDKHLDRNARVPNKKRPLVVIEVNENNELAVVQLSTQEGKHRSELKSYNTGKKDKDGKTIKTYYKHFVEIKDSDGNPIKVGVLFNENPPHLDVNDKELKEIINKVLYHSAPALDNQEKLKNFRKKKNPRN